MASDLEEHYMNILGNPEEGNLSELEKKYKGKSAEYLVSRNSDGVDISLIQRSGELTSAYLYLKAKWELANKTEPFVPRILRIENPTTPPLTVLERVHIKLHNMALGGLVLIGIISLYQLGTAFFDNSLRIAFNKPHDLHALANTIKEEDAYRNGAKEIKTQKLKENRTTFVDKMQTKQDNSAIHFAAKNCDLNAIENLATDSNLVNLRDVDGATPLHWVARMNCVRGAEILLNKGANKSILDKTGRTPLEWARNSNNFETEQIISKN